MRSARDNQWLIVKSSVVLTTIIEPKIITLDQIFKAHNTKSYVTSGLRDAYEQLDIIRQYLVAKGFDKQFPNAMTCELLDTEGLTGKVVYKWQLGWSKLLSAGVIINPPLRAEVLMDYMRNGKNLKGKILNQTPHVTGKCFDIGGAGGTITTIKDELAIMQDVMKNKRIPGLINILPEHNNNCIHCDCV